MSAPQSSSRTKASCAVSGGHAQTQWGPEACHMQLGYASLEFLAFWSSSQFSEAGTPQKSATNPVVFGLKSANHLGNFVIFTTQSPNVVACATWNAFATAGVAVWSEPTKSSGPGGNDQSAKGPDRMRSKDCFNNMIQDISKPTSTGLQSQTKLKQKRANKEPT